MDTDVHRERLVEPGRAAPARPAVPERQGRALLPALRHRALEPRGRPGLRGGGRPLGLRALPRCADAPDESLLVWTTTPWTLPANQAAAVNPDVTYAAVEHGGETLILAEPLVPAGAGRGRPAVAPIPAAELVGREYEPPFPYVERRPPRGATAAFVTTEDGTGIVHIAPAFGEDDMASPASTA